MPTGMAAHFLSVYRKTIYNLVNTAFNARCCCSAGPGVRGSYKGRSTINGQRHAGSTAIFLKYSALSGPQGGNTMPARLTTASMLAFAVLTIAMADVSLNVGDDFQQKVDANPGNTTFIIKKGLHRLQRVSPKDGNVFVGEDGAVMSGARVLSDWHKEGSYWVHGGQTQNGKHYGNCRDERESCAHPEDLYMDGDFLEQVDALSDVASGCWYFDYGADKVYMADDPGDHLMEISVKDAAFRSTAYGVTIKNLTIERYATPVKDGAVMRDPRGTEDGSKVGRGWVVENCDIGYNHALAMKICMLDNVRIRGNKLHHNGQIGIVTVKGTDMLFEFNEVSHNCIEHLHITMAEEGGTKFVRSRDAVIRYNWVHHNSTAGLWADIDNHNALYEGNLVEYNGHQGLFHEIGGSAKMRCNICRHNGIRWSAWLYGANILVSASSDVEVYHNIVEVDGDGDHEIGGNGICIVYQPKLRSYECERNYVHHNDITYLGARGLTGIGNDDPEEATRDAWWAQTTNKFDYNTYHAPDLTAALWNWMYWRDWEDFRAQGQEEHGTLDDDFTARKTLHSYDDCTAAAAVWDSLVQIWPVEIDHPCKDNRKAPPDRQSFSGDIIRTQESIAMSVYTLRGRRVLQARHSARLNLSSLPHGSYVVRIGMGATGQTRTITLAR
ncbi:MAG: hypothetical protein GF418_12310 [Chitinivibrionales bacterium]|nr:hypothetical protein [Chitinivibrionales bacterium]